MGSHPIPSKQLRHSNGHSTQIWRATDRSRQMLCVWHLIGEGVAVEEACSRAGISYGKYKSLLMKNPAYAKKHRESTDSLAINVENALVQGLIHGTKDVIEQYDAEGQLVGKQVRTHAPDPKAAHKWLASRNPEQFSERASIDVGVTYQPLAISVQPVAIDAEVSETKQTGVVIDV